MTGDSFMVASPVGVGSGQLCVQGGPGLPYQPPMCVMCVSAGAFLACVACCASVSVWAFVPVMNVTEDTDREQLYCSCESVCVNQHLAVPEWGVCK